MVRNVEDSGVKEGPDSAALRQVLATDELHHRPTRAPDYVKESQCLRALARTLATDPENLLQELVDSALELTGAGSSGVSILEGVEGARSAGPSGNGAEGAAPQRFRWHAIAGEYREFVAETMPRDQSPCGIVLERDDVLLFQRPELHFPYPVLVEPPQVEALLVPFHLEGRAVGTLWVVSHSEETRFDGEDARILESLCEFAGAAHQINAAREAWAREAGVRKAREEELRESEAMLAAELASTRKVQEVSGQLLPKDDPTTLYEGIVDAASEVLDSDMAAIQLLNPRRGELKLIVAKGFSVEAADYFAWVGGHARTSCGQALASSQRVIVPNLEECEWMAESEELEVYRGAGIGAVQSTPLFSRSGALLGVLSTHWRRPHEPCENALRHFDGLARQAADLIERTGREKALREVNETLEDRVRQGTRTVQELATRLTRAEQAERRRIADVLHDDLQQGLYAAQLKVHLLQRRAELVEVDPDLLRYAQEAIATFDEVMSAARRLTVDLSPIVVEGEGLRSVLNRLQRQMKELYDFDVELDSVRDYRVEDDDLRVLLFQVVRELLFNTVKHGETDHARVELSEDNGWLTVKVTDHGRGFDVEETGAREPGREGFGLFAARERVRLFGGHMDIRSEPGNGTCVTVHAPLSDANV